MEITTNELNVNVVINTKPITNGQTPIIFLHGFTGSAHDWNFIFNKLPENYYPISIDLPGHGLTTTPNRLNYFSTESYIQTINGVTEKLQLKKVVLLGYSMGGRAALQFANKYPEKIKALILESSTAGIEEKKERESRIKIDSELSDKLLRIGINKFIDNWMELPFFVSLKKLNKTDYQKIITEKKRNSAIGLANSLLGFSTGKMPSLWNKLDNFNIPVLLIAGSLDRKFVRLNKMMKNRFRNGEIKIIENAGHNTHLENPNEFTILVNNFLKTLE